ncbi:hypothetical protein A6280_17575 [Bacillus wiedmannii]|nr:hypothetical protein A6280_17575 [Bacillus wiedmannii]OUB82271.1 hypothetical protein BK788_19830 [Bacillus thuringiensis serovar sinensis]PEO27016.1 hypothetical protein CN555_26410 [Bacillus wiedmannii]
MKKVSSKYWRIPFLFGIKKHLAKGVAAHAHQAKSTNYPKTISTSKMHKIFALGYLFFLA